MFIGALYAHPMRLWRMALIAVTIGTLTACSAGANSADTAGPPPTMLADPAVFLEHVKTTWAGPIPADEVLVERGSVACAQLQAGIPHPSVTIFPGAEQPSEVTANTRSVVDAAALSLCPAATQ